MIDNLHDFFKSVSTDTHSNSHNTKFVYYDNKTGKIEKISNHGSDQHDCLEVLLEEVKDILIGKKDLTNYKVIFDFEKRQLQLRENSLFKTPTVTEKLYNIPQNEQDPDIIISCGTNKWTVRLAPKHQDYFRSMKSVIDNLKFNFSITNKNDPNILIGMFNISLDDLLSNPEVDVSEQIDIPKNMKNCSIYTFKYFNAYSYEIINE